MHISLRYCKTILVLSICMLFTIPYASKATPLHITCVESVWCDIAKEVGGNAISTHALITTEGLDLHHLRPTPSMARQLSQADATLINGATYDDWALSLLPPSSVKFVAAQYGKKWHNGDDPHLFFDPDTVTQVADAFAHWLISKNPNQKDDINARLAHFYNKKNIIIQRLNDIRSRFHDQPVAVTEPAGEILLHRSGLSVINHRWAFATMNENGVSPQETALLEQRIANNGIRFLLVNPTVSSPQINNLIQLAHAHAIPTIQAGETLPNGLSWATWLTKVIDQIDDTLTHSKL